MRNATSQWRKLLLLAILMGFAGSAYAQRTVTLRLNTATLPDTLNVQHEVQVRGCLEGCTGDQSDLPGGDVIAWNDNTTLKPANVGGDYWETTFQVPDTATTMFKFYAQLAEDNGIGGWEDGENHVLEPGTGDTTLTLHFFEKGADKAYDWRPWEVKEDSVAVLFRVAMFGERARLANYDPAANEPDQIVGVRGDGLGGASSLDWGATNLHLQRESNTGTGMRMYSGVAYYPKSAAGTTQPYKFVLERGATVGWEEGDMIPGDRTFVVPEQDTTLHWVYFANTAPSAVEPVESLVLFTVDLSPFEEIGVFDQARGDTLWVYGGFNNWQNCPAENPDLCLMAKVPGENQFELAVPFNQQPGGNVSYKYFLDFNDATFQDVFGMEPPSGWEEGHATGINRTFTYEDKPEHVLELAYYNDITSENVIPEGTPSIDVHFSVDMTPALNSVAQPFNPAGGDSVTIRINDPVWAFTQGLVGSPRGENDFVLFIDRLVLEDPDGDNVYTGTLTVETPTYSAITYRYEYGQGTTWTDEEGTDTNAPGRNRVHYIKPNTDGSWPTSYTLPEHTFNATAGALPYETNPAFGTAIEEVDGALPTQIALGQNYPNPFNPTTSFEYSLTSTQPVTVRVFDVLGRTVATLVDGVQTAATYRVTFDASHLASGIYVYQLQTPTQVITKKMMLVK